MAEQSLVVQSSEQAEVALDFEQEFINHLADQVSVEFVLREGVTNDLLLSPRTKKVYEFVGHHFNQTGKMPALRVLKSEFPNIEWETPDTTINYVIDKLRERYQRNQIGTVLVDVAGVAQADPGEAMKRLRHSVFEIEKNSLSQRHVWKPGDHKLFLRNLQQKVLEGAFQGTSIGFKEIDDFTGGIKDGNLVYILARPKRQKTFTCLNCFIEMARDGRKPYLATLENTEDEIMLRISCMLSGYPWDLAQKGVFDTKAYKLLNKAWEEFNTFEHYIEMPPMDERTVPALVSKADKLGAEAVVISQFKYIKGLKDFYRAEHEEKAEVAVDLKRAAIRPGSERPFVIEAQFNRGGDSMEELEDFDAGKVGLTDMIPQSADTLYGLFQSKDLRANGTIEFGILEARNHGKAAWYIETEFVNRTEFRLLPSSRH